MDDTVAHAVVCTIGSALEVLTHPSISVLLSPIPPFRRINIGIPNVDTTIFMDISSTTTYLETAAGRSNGHGLLN